MSSFERVSLLDDRLLHERQLHLSEASLLLGVSEMTVRRDIARHSSVLAILGGYVVKLSAALRSMSHDGYVNCDAATLALSLLTSMSRQPCR
ncbi:DeoR family transcriptional regulator [Caballeronia grimmiae]|uniref:DeoR family transcriptional regulator n=1 Tax=Caballeronia grimmiae TaxID=1071679 RepID=UPI0038BB66CD